jgi:phosphoribosylformimino-5-aminoimidazole carboxamide ribonucleotide (ProFAR) isomerase
MGSQEAKMLQGKYDESKQALKENQEALSEFLLDFYEKMHVKEIDDMEGKQRDLVIRVSVAPPKNV